eukprot:SAG31_NODE_3385_length_4331_cov_2.491493_1_plen_362_part_00
MVAKTKTKTPSPTTAAPAAGVQQLTPSASSASSASTKKRPGRPRKYKTVEERRQIRLEKNREAAKRLYARKVGGFKNLENEVLGNRAAVAVSKAKLRTYEDIFKRAGMNQATLKALLEAEMARVLASRRQQTAQAAAAPAAAPAPAAAASRTVKSKSAHRRGPSDSSAAMTKAKFTERDGTRTPDSAANAVLSDARSGSLRHAQQARPASFTSRCEDYSSDDDAAAFTMLQLLQTAAPPCAGKPVPMARDRATYVKAEDDLDDILNMDCENKPNCVGMLSEKGDPARDGHESNNFRRSASLRSILAPSLSSERPLKTSIENGASTTTGAPMTLVNANCTNNAMVYDQVPTTWRTPFMAQVM